MSFHIYEDLICSIEVVIQPGVSKHNPYLGKLPFDLMAGMLREEIQAILGYPHHESDKKMTTYAVNNQPLDCYFCHDMYNFPDGHLTVQYNYYSKKIERIIISKS